jgi:anti-sigma B factor antagonist
MDQAYELSQSGRVKLLRVHNLLSEFTNREILGVVQDCIDEGHNKFIVDLEGMPYTNSVGLNFLISLQARCQDKAGSLVIMNVSKKILQLLEVTKLQPLFHLTDSVDEALRLLDEV